ncbi:TonB-dependent receptor plug domain-containing protein [Gimibacter soli]|uniref:TonB-dependent receptor n=1 Tax=Gimibacter soli TaxID=3024400 RepID=A0AAE9XQJ9_9PROT|nr:TonB-dependent receptor [Gimibacter soli]WCL54397.1 TonB-dependent receptor [Gimibacter soli]
MKKLIVMASALIPATVSNAAFAQAVNYGDLQELFGEPVTTSATGKPQRQSEAPASMVIITGEEVRRSGVRTIPDILQNYAGIDVNRYATGQREVGIRGANMPLNPRLLVMVNGRQTYLDHYGYTDWSLLGIEMSEIQQIEVVKGPNSALFGFNAVAGVVNIITVDPLSTGNSFHGSAQGGTDGTYELSAVGNMKINDKVGMKFSGGVTEANDWKGITADHDPARENFSAELVAQLASNIRADASYTYSKSRQIMQAYQYDLYNFTTTLESLNGSVAADTSLGLIKAQVYKNSVEQDTPGIGNSISNVVIAKLEDLFKIGARHSVRLGLEYRRDELEFVNEDAGQTYYSVYSGSGMWEWQVTDKLVLTNALRLDKLNLGHGPIGDPRFPYTQADYDRSMTEYSYNSSLAYTIDDETRVRIGTARGVQAPALVGFGAATQLPSGFYYAGSPNLNASINQAYEIALDRNVAAINGAFNITGSLTKVSDFLAAGQNVTINLPTAEYPYVRLTEDVIGDFKAYAIEATLRGRTMNDKLGWAVNYTWTDVKEDFLSPATEAIISLDEGTAAHKLNVKLDYVDGPFNAYVVGRYRSSTEQRLVTGPGYRDLGGNVTVDAKVAYAMDNGISLWMTGENLTANNAAGLSVFKADTRVLMGIGFNF